MAYLGLFFAGIFLCNALPHLLKGLHGERFYTPWAKPPTVGTSSAVENVLWGCANLLVAVFLIDRIFLKNVPHGMVALAAGFVVTAVGLAMLFAKRSAS